MAYGLTEQGYKAKRLADIKLEIENDLRSSLGNRINLLPESVFGQIVGIISERLSELWEKTEEIYNSQYPDTATGVSLDEVCAITGITRRSATKSVQKNQILIGTVGEIIPLGTTFSVQGNPSALFQTESDVTLIAGVAQNEKIEVGNTQDGAYSVKINDTTITFNAASLTIPQIVAGLVSQINASSEPVTATDNGTYLTVQADLAGRPFRISLVSNPNLSMSLSQLTPNGPQGLVTLVAVNTGPIQAPAYTLTEIETPVTGLDETINTEDASIGRNLETDVELRIRREETLQIAGAATIEAIKSALLELTDVTAAVIFQNNSNVIDPEGRPPHSVDIVVQGGAQAEIAQSIFENVAAGIETIGSIMETVVDSQGFDQDIYFSRPDEVEIYLEIDLTVNPNKFPTNGSTLVRDALLNFGNSLTIGEDVVVYPSLICSINEIPGITDVVIRIGTALNPTLDDNIAISPREISAWDSSRILVTVL